MDVDVPLLDIKKCQQAYKKDANIVIDNRVLCAGYLEGRLDSCQVFIFLFFFIEKRLK